MFWLFPTTGLRVHACYHNDVDDSPDSPFSRNFNAVFLDRDGVLNEKMPEGCYVTSWADFHILPGVPEAIARLNRAGLKVIVVTNQRGIALGLYTPAHLEALHACFHDLLKPHGAHVDAFYFCPHDKNQCDCRKPLPGMFEQAKLDFPEIDASTSVMIGDSVSDIEFGRNLGMMTVLIEGNRHRHRPGAKTAAKLADLCFPALPAAVDELLAKRQ
jgi:D-glycero-D-manno-heptose 1,7-bisphosphate phosphatase